MTVTDGPVCPLRGSVPRVHTDLVSVRLVPLGLSEVGTPSAVDQVGDGGAGGGGSFLRGPREVDV